MAYALVACTGNNARGNGGDDSEEEAEVESFVDMMSPDELNRFYEELLDAFCVKYYDDNLPGKYIQGSIRVTGSSKKDTHTDEVIGTHSFEGNGYFLGKDFTEKGFVATVTRDGDGLYHVNFSRRLVKWPTQKEGDWRYTGDLPFEYQQPE